MYGLVLEGGGAKGAYHVGACKALKELDFHIDGVSGTSIGALNAAMIVQDDLEALEDLWLNVGMDTLFNFDTVELDKIKKLNLAEANIPYVLRKSKDIIANKGLDTTEIKRIIGSYIDEDKVRNSDKDFGMVTVSLTDMKPLELLKEDIPKGKMVDYLMASCNLPAFKLEKLDGKFMIDGGYYDNLPFNVLMKKGYKDFIAIRTYGIGMTKKVDTKKINVIYVQPVEDLGVTIDFDAKRSAQNIKLGYFDTMKVFNKLKGFKYYIKPYKKNFVKYLLNYFDGSEEKIINTGKILGVSKYPPYRMLFEKITPKIQGVVEYSNSNDYEDIIIRLVETVAEKYEDIDRFKIYDTDKFIELVCKKFKEKPLKCNENLPGIFKASRLLSLTVKDDILISIFKALFINE